MPSTATSYRTDSEKKTSSSKSESPCTPCGKLLHQVLFENKESRPHQLLRALMEANPRQQQQHVGQQKPETPFHWRPLPDGLQVKILGDEVSSSQQQHLTSRRTLQLATSPLLHNTADSTADTTTNDSEWLTFTCRSCLDTGPERNARAFVMGPTPLSIVVCTNRLQNKFTEDSNNNSLNKNKSQPGSKISSTAEMDEILTHELVHVYDVRRLQLDLRDCDMLAYSEVRAAREAECWSVSSRQNPWFRTRGTLTGGGGRENANSNSTNHHNNPQLLQCVQKKALAATQNLFGVQSRACVQRVLQSAMQDRRPFGSTIQRVATTTASAAVYPIATAPSKHYQQQASSR